MFCGRSDPSAEDISRSLAALMYSGRPVEGAASGATSGVAAFYFFIFYFESNQNAPRKRVAFIVLGWDPECQPSALPSAPRSPPELRPRPGAFSENRSSLPARRRGHNNPQCEPFLPPQGVKVRQPPRSQFRTATLPLNVNENQLILRRMKQTGEARRRFLRISARPRAGNGCHL